MSKFSIGIMTESFRLPLEQSLETAKTLGVDGVQLNAASRELPVDAVTSARIREVRDMLNSHGLVVSAVCGDFGGHGFALEAENPVRVDRSKRVVDLALELGSRVVTTHIGVVPEDRDCRRYHVMQAACNALAEYAHKARAYFAIETGPETAVTLRAFLDSLSTKGVAVNLDPANLVMVTGDDPAKAVHTLGDYVVHTHAKDGVMVKQTDPRVIYDFFAEGGIGDLRLDEYFREVPLGRGGVDFDAWTSALTEIGYGGFLTVEREVGADPKADIRLAVEFLQKYR